MKQMQKKFGLFLAIVLLLACAIPFSALAEDADAPPVVDEGVGGGETLPAEEPIDDLPDGTEGLPAPSVEPAPTNEPENAAPNVNSEGAANTVYCMPGTLGRRLEQSDDVLSFDAVYVGSTSLTGMGTPGATVLLLRPRDGAEYTATVENDASFTIDLSGATLVNGDHFYLYQTEEGKSRSNGKGFIISYSDASAAPQAHHNFYVDSLVLTGTGVAFAEIDVYIGGSKVGDTTVLADGTWSFTFANQLPVDTEITVYQMQTGKSPSIPITTRCFAYPSVTIKGDYVLSDDDLGDSSPRLYANIAGGAGGSFEVVWTAPSGTEYQTDLIYHIADELGGWQVEVIDSNGERATASFTVGRLTDYATFDFEIWGDTAPGIQVGREYHFILEMKHLSSGNASDTTQFYLLDISGVDVVGDYGYLPAPGITARMSAHITPDTEGTRYYAVVATNGTYTEVILAFSIDIVAYTPDPTPPPGPEVTFAGLPNTVRVGTPFTLTQIVEVPFEEYEPEPGTWTYDDAFFKADIGMFSSTFTPLKEGTTTISYATSGGDSTGSITITILPAQSSENGSNQNDSTTKKTLTKTTTATTASPKTGDNTSIAVWTLVMALPTYFAYGLIAQKRKAMALAAEQANQGNKKG